MLKQRNKKQCEAQTLEDAQAVQRIVIPGEPVKGKSTRVREAAVQSKQARASQQNHQPPENDGHSCQGA